MRRIAMLSVSALLLAVGGGSVARAESTGGVASTGGAQPAAATPAPASAPASPPSGSLPASLADAARRLGQHRLKRGSRGDEVRVLQLWLSDLGYRVAAGGSYDRATVAAVRRFQSDHGLAADGVVGRGTVNALRSARSARQAAAGTEDWVFPIQPIARVAPPSYWSPDQGIDIPPFPGFCGKQLPLVAVADGTVVAEGISGFGSQSPILKIAHGRYAGRYVYYGHSQPALVPVGARVTAGQPIAQVGCGRVGESQTPHLEIGISRAGGPTCCPGFGETAPLIQGIMLDLYRRAKAQR
jgi:murein DD-endopeptidase MepM/ murein hydrolase activator NlpD